MYNCKRAHTVPEKEYCIFPHRENLPLLYVYGNNIHMGTAEYGEKRTRKVINIGLEVELNAGNKHQLWRRM